MKPLGTASVEGLSHPGSKDNLNVGCSRLKHRQHCKHRSPEVTAGKALASSEAGQRLVLPTAGVLRARSTCTHLNGRGCQQIPKAQIKPESAQFSRRGPTPGDCLQSPTGDLNVQLSITASQFSPLKYTYRCISFA